MKDLQTLQSIGSRMGYISGTQVLQRVCQSWYESIRPRITLIGRLLGGFPGSSSKLRNGNIENRETTFERVKRDEMYLEWDDVRI
jgi:hypothetical protein